MDRSLQSICDAPYGTLQEEAAADVQLAAALDRPQDAGLTSGHTSPAKSFLTALARRVPLTPTRSKARAEAFEANLTKHLKPTPHARLPRGMYRRVFSYFMADKKLIGIYLVAIALSIGLGLLQAWPIPVLMDSILTATPRTDWIHRLFLAPLPETMLGQVVGIAIVAMLMKIVQDILTLVKNMLNNRINNWGVMRVRNDLFQKLQELDLAYHQRQGSGEAMYRVCNDAQGLQMILNVLINASVAAATLVVMAGIMFSCNVTLTIYALAVTPAVILTNYFFGKRIRLRNIRAKETDTNMVSNVQRTMGVIGLTQIFSRQRTELNEFKGITDKTARVWLKLNWIQETYWLIVRTIFSLGGAVILGYGGYLVWRDQFSNPITNGMTLGTLLAFISYLGQMWDPLTRLTGVSADIQPGVAGTQRVFEVLDTPPRIRDAEEAFALPLRPRPLELRGVGFHYSADKPVLHNISATIEPGEMVAFVGPSGAGKSTLLNLLPRFYDVVGGKLLLDGIDIRKISLSDLRKHIALVPQENLILSASVAENIAYGKVGASMAQIRRAARMAGCEEFILEMPEGYDTLLGEGGQQISGGQRQRLAIARALLTEAPILVLDEPTSALDPHYERIVTETLQSLKGKRTIILVSHRLGTVADCDRIYVLDEGRVAECGGHEELMSRHGLYYKLVKQQQSLDTIADPAWKSISAA